MKPLPILATTNAVLAAISASLAIAPLTGALTAFFFWLPFAAYFAHNNQTVAAVAVPVFAVLALLLSPIQLNHASIYLFGAWIIWTCIWSLAIVYFSWRKIQAAITSIRGSWRHGT